MRATWKGILKISLVNIPIKVYPATESSETLALHQLHATCTSRLQQKRWCPACAREVSSGDIVKGFEFAKGQYVILSEADVDQVRPLSTRVIDLVQFASADALDPMYLDRAYYLAPDGGPASAAYAVMRDAMNGKVGIGKLALYGREYLVAVRPQLWVLMLYTLHHAAVIRPIDAIEDLNSVAQVAKRDEVKLARSVIAAFDGPLNLVDYQDEYREGLQSIIDAKVLGKQIVVPTLAAAPPTMNLVDALTQSLQAVSAAKKKPAKVSPAELSAAAAAKKRKRA